ncbi:macro domain-containing protein [Desulfocurvus sp. DL9XJH121]
MTPAPQCWNLPGGALCVRRGDLARSTADAVVNAANPQLAGGGGVDGALHRAAGPELLAAGRAWVRDNGPLPTGRAVITPGFGLAAKWVIHTVGPVWRGGANDEDALLASAYAGSMRLAREHGAASVDFPAVSCGVYGFPMERAATIALSTLAENLAPGVVKTASMVIFSADAAALWAARARELFGPPA